MKISRRSVLHISGLAAAALALTGCSAAGSAALGGKLPGLLKGLAKKGETTASSEAASDMAVTPPLEGEQLDPAFGVMPEYDADILTGAERSTNSRPVAVMVNNIANSQRQNARPQRGIGSADLLIEAKVEGGITRLCAVFSDADSIPEVGPIRSGRDQFLQLLMPWDILYYHDGESIFCTQFVSVYGYSGLNIGGKNYFKTPIHPIVSHRNNRGRDVAYEHTEFTSGKEICKAASDAGISLYAPSEGTFFHFADYRTDEVNKLKGEPSAKKIAIVHSESYRTSFSYSALSHTYAMQMYNSSKKATENTVDELTGEQLTFENGGPVPDGRRRLRRHGRLRRRLPRRAGGAVHQGRRRLPLHPRRRAGGPLGKDLSHQPPQALHQVRRRDDPQPGQDLLCTGGQRRAEQFQLPVSP